MRKLLLFSILLILVGNVGATTFTITSLPYAAPNHSGDTWDTLVLQDSFMTSTNHGIYFKDNHNSKWLIDLSGTDGIPGNADDHIIEFGTDTSFFQDPPYALGLDVGGCGLITGPNGGSIGDSIIVRGGFWLHRPEGITPTTDYGVRGGARGRSYNFHLWHGCTNFVLDSVAGAEIRGFQSSVGDAGTHNVWARNSEGLRITGSRLYNHVYGWTSRVQFHTSNVKYVDAVVNNYQSGNFTVRIEDSYLESQGHCGVVMWGGLSDTSSSSSYITFQMVNCSIYVDQRNTWTQWQYVNGWGAMIRDIGGDSSYVKDNMFVSGDNYNGGRGMEMREWNTKGPSGGESWADTIEVSGNYFDNHQGYGSEYPVGGWRASCLKIRRGNHHTWVHDNVFVITLDTASVPNSGYTPMGYAIHYQVEMDSTDGNRSPYHTVIENNICSVKVITPNKTYHGAAMAFHSTSMFTDYDTTIKVRNNYFYSEGGFGLDISDNWDAPPRYTMIMNDTFEVVNTKGVFYGTVNQGNVFESKPNIIRDCVYLGDGGPTSYSQRTALGFFGPSCGSGRDLYWQWQSERTLDLYAYGNNSLPVQNAACSVWNQYDALIFTGTTDANGLVSDVVRYYWHSMCDTDTTDSPFTIEMTKASDSTINATFTAGWTAAGGTDTLVLAATEGAEAVIDTRMAGNISISGKVIIKGL